MSWAGSGSTGVCSIQSSTHTPRLPSRGSAAAVRRRKTFAAGADAVAPENIDRGRDDQKCETEQDRDQADRDQGQRQIALGVDEPVMDRGQHEGKTEKADAAAREQQPPHPAELAEALARDVGSGRVMASDAPYQADGEGDRAEADQQA